MGPHPPTPSLLDLSPQMCPGHQGFTTLTQLVVSVLWNVFSPRAPAHFERCLHEASVDARPDFILRPRLIRVFQSATASRGRGACKGALKRAHFSASPSATLSPGSPRRWTSAQLPRRPGWSSYFHFFPSPMNSALCCWNNLSEMNIWSSHSSVKNHQGVLPLIRPRGLGSVVGLGLPASPA